MKKVMLVFGTRPEAIKMAPLVKALQNSQTQFETVVCVTGQHREMLDQVLEVFQITPDYDLNIMKPGQDLCDITTHVLQGMKEVLCKVSPQLVLVHGDTTTSMAAALAAFYQHIPVAHVEAGLRTYDKYSPWPEEINRQMTARIASWHFAPTARNRDNLLNEGVEANDIFVTGNTVIDALHWILQKEGIVPSANTEGRRMVLVTCHRRENFGEGLTNVCRAIQDLCLKYPDVDFVVPMHPNPHLRKTIQDIWELGERPDNLILREPFDYLGFIKTMANATLILTDSGGIQEEAPGLGKPVLVMRQTTERAEALEAGTVKLVGTCRETIVREASRLLDDEAAYQHMAKAVNPYGDGTACEKIVRILQDTLAHSF